MRKGDDFTALSVYTFDMAEAQAGCDAGRSCAVYVAARMVISTILQRYVKCRTGKRIKRGGKKAYVYQKRRDDNHDYRKYMTMKE